MPPPRMSPMMKNRSIVRVIAGFSGVAAWARKPGPPASVPGSLGVVMPARYPLRLEVVAAAATQAVRREAERQPGELADGVDDRAADVRARAGELDRVEHAVHRPVAEHRVRVRPAAVLLDERPLEVGQLRRRAGARRAGDEHRAAAR